MPTSDYWETAQRFMPPTPVTRTIAGVLVASTLPFAVASAKSAPRVRWGSNENRLLWTALAMPGALTVGAIGVLATGQARWLIPSLAVSSACLVAVADGLTGSLVPRFGEPPIRENPLITRGAALRKVSGSSEPPGSGE